MIIRQLQPLKPNFCPVCQERFIDDKGKPMPNHSQKLVILTGGHTTHIAVCKKCKAKMTNENWKKVVKLNMEYVAEHMENKLSKEILKGLEFKGFK